MPQSKALEVNLRTSRVCVTLDPKYEVLLEIASDYYGLQQSIEAFLKEVCHPYKNWYFIVGEARRLALNNFHLVKEHPKGPHGVKRFVDIFLDAVSASKDEELRSDAVDNLLLYLQQIINESGPNLDRFLEVVNYGFEELTALDEDDFFLVVRSFYQLGDLAAGLLGKADGAVGQAVGPLLYRYLDRAYAYWLGEPDPCRWFEDETGQTNDSSPPADLFAPISHARLMELRGELADIGQYHSDVSLTRLIALPGFREIVKQYDRLPRELAKAGESTDQGDQWHLIFLFFIMNISGLSSIHERALREINRNLARMIGLEEVDKVQSLIGKTFGILESSIRKYPGTALSSVLNMGKAVYRTDESDMVEAFIDNLVNLGFQTPGIHGVGDDWQIRSNEAHVQNIRVWVELIGLKPRWSKALLSALTIHLALGGAFIKDTDLFPRDITGLLNSDIAPVYNLVKQLCRLFPAYFNEIGAEGRLRDTSTKIDELVLRKDPLVHFLRKQSHVESSPRTVVLMEAALEFWRTKDKAVLSELLPPSIFAQISDKGPNVDGLHHLMNALFETGKIESIKDMLSIPEGRLFEDGLPLGTETGPEDLQRFELAHALYQILHQKYHTGTVGLLGYLHQLSPEFHPYPELLKQALTEEDPRLKLISTLDYLEILNERVLSPEAFEIREDIYIKRHIAVDIPSMYGSYHEAKFDALGLTFRLESLINTLFQELIDTIDLKLITRATFVQIHDLLRLFDRALKLDGISSREMERQIDLLSHSLNIRGFSYTQYMDIFRGFSQVVSNIVNDHFNNIHQNQLVKIIGLIDTDELLPKYLPGNGVIETKEAVHRISEIFLRDRIATSLGLQQFDQFVTRVLNTIFHQGHELRQNMLRQLLNYDPDKAATMLEPVNPRIADVINLGAKGFNLVRLIALGLPVPSGFIITTEVFRCWEIIDSYAPAREHFQNLVRRQLSQLEYLTGKKFGDRNNPLLLSVRSGSSISQPGMLSTFLDVGLNEDIAEGMAGGTEEGAWFSWDCYRRYLQTYGMAHGLIRDDFDALMAEAKNKYSLPYKRNFAGNQMKEVALTYRDYIQSHDITLEEDPFEQLCLGIKAVFESWTSARANTYRQIMGISRDWGTAVTVQSMVFGNQSERTGSGVLFTHNPRWARDKLMLWGDFALSNQGEDVVSGLVETLPISRAQLEIENRTATITLETHFPEIYYHMRQMAKKLVYTHGYSPQEIEFTFEGVRSTDLFLLQTRDMVLRKRRESQNHEVDITRMPPELFLAHGIGVSGGGLTGRIVFSLDEIKRWRESEPKTPLILIRNDTVPDDIREINEADGLLTARGGSTSHAAIVAYRLNKTCIVGCAELSCNENDQVCSLGLEVLHSGAWITMDGLGGAIYKGRMMVDTEQEERRMVRL